MLEMVLAIVHVLRTVDMAVLYCNLVYVRDLRLPCDYGKVDGAMLWIMHHPFHHEGKDSSCESVGTYGKGMHCPSMMRRGAVVSELLAESLASSCVPQFI